MIPTERLIDCYLDLRSRQLQRGQPAMVPTVALISSEPGECARLSVLVRESDRCGVAACALALPGSVDRTERARFSLASECLPPKTTSRR